MTISARWTTLCLGLLVALAMASPAGAVPARSREEAATTPPPAPRIRVTQAWDGAAVAKGATVTYTPNVPAGTADSRLFTIYNDGNATLTISNPGTLVSGTGWSLILAPASSIAPGANSVFRVRILSGTGGTYTGTVSIQSNDAANNPYTFSVRATVDPPPAPRIRVAQAWDGATVAKGATVIYTPNVPANAADSRLFTIYNDGNATLSITNPSTLVSGTGWSLLQAPASSIAPGGNSVFRVRILSGTGGTYTGTVSIQSNDAANNPYTFSVRATVDPPPAPRIRVAQAWDGATVAKGATVIYTPNVPANTADSRLFTIYNDGNATLSITNPSTLVSGTGWSLLQAPASSIAPGGNSVFRVRILSGTGGTYTGTVSIQSNDAANNPYTFSVRATVDPPPAPQIRVQAWNGVTVAKGAIVTYTPNVPAGASDSRLFTIYNDGNATLTITNPNSLVSGTGWSLIVAPPSTIAAGGNGIFRVRILSNTGGTYTGTVSIASDDPDDNPYTFSVRATVDPPPAPQIRVQAWNGVTVAKGAIVTYTPNVPAGTSDSRLFTIYNDGNATLSITNPNTLVSGTGWSLLQAPPSTIAAGGNGSFRVRILSATGGTYTGTVSIGSDDPDDNPFTFSVRATVDPPLVPQIRVTQAWNGVAVAKGALVTYTPNVPANTADSRLFTIYNDGNAALTITNPNTLVSGTGWSLLQAPLSPIAAGGNSSFRVRILAGTAGTYTGTVSVASDDPDDNPFTFSVRATVDAPLYPEIRVFQAWDGVEAAAGSTFVFPDLDPGIADSRLYRIQNDGPGTLHISNPAALVSGTCFSQLGDAAATLAQGESTTFRVRLLCSSTGTLPGTVSIASDDPDENPYTFFARGRVGTLPPLRVVSGDGVEVAAGGTYTFPDWAVSQSISRGFTIWNDGTSDLTLVATGGLVSGAGFTQIVEPSTPVIPAGGSVAIRVRLLASTPGSYAGAVALETTTPSQRPFRFNLAGRLGVLDFSLAASPASQNPIAGQSVNYTVTVAGSFGFAESVALSVSGLPVGATYSFNPASVIPGGSATLHVATSLTTPPGTSTLAVSGTGGGITRGTSVSLAVRSPTDFSLTASPSSQPVRVGGSAVYTVTVTGDAPVAGGIALSVAGLPVGASASFSPATVQVGDSSTLTVATALTTPLGAVPMTVSGSGGGQVRTVGVEIVVETTAAPVISAISPDTLVSGGRTVVTLTGENLAGAAISIPTAQPDPDDVLVLRRFPGARVTGGSPDGRSLQVELDATDPAILDFYNLQVDNGAGRAVTQVRVLPPGPLIDAWTPSQAEVGKLYVLTLVGRHLLGATVTPSLPGRIELSDLDTGHDDRIDGLLEVLPGAPLGGLELIVQDGQGRQVRVPITVVAEGASSAPAQELTATRKGVAVAPPEGSRWPRIFVQQLSVRRPGGEGAAGDGPFPLPPPGAAPAAAEKFYFPGVYVEIRQTVAYARYQRSYLFDPLTGKRGDSVLRGLGLGGTANLGAFVFSFYLRADLVIYYRLFGSGPSFPLFCLEIASGSELTGFDGFAYYLSYCTGNGWTATGTGSVTREEIRGGPCARAIPEGGIEEGVALAEIEQTGCCEQPIGVAASGSTFTGLFFGGNFDIDTPNVGKTTPHPQCKECEGDDTAVLVTGSLGGAASLSSPAAKMLCLARTPFPPGRMRFLNATPAQLAGLAVIPEHGDIVQRVTANDTWYEGDGLFADGQQCINDTQCSVKPRTRWFKVPGHCDVELTFEANGDVTWASCCNLCATAVYGEPRWSEDCHEAFPKNPFCGAPWPQ